MVEARISGTLAAAVTPLCDGGARLDEEALAAVLDFYGRSGLDGLLVLGTTGEGILLGDGERRRVAELAVAGASALSVVVHCGADDAANLRARGSRRRGRRGGGCGDRTAVFRLRRGGA